MAENYLSPFRYLSPSGVVTSLPVMPGISDAYTHGLAVDLNGNLLVSATFYGAIVDAGRCMEDVTSLTFPDGAVCST